MSNGDTHEISSRDLWWDKERREDLRVVYKATQDSRIDFRVRIWETIKTSILLSAGLFAVAGGIWSHDRVTPWILILYGVALVVLGLWLGRWTYANTMREQSLQFYDEFTLFQIEKLLGLHQKIKEDSRWMRKEDNGWQKEEAEHMFDWKHLYPSLHPSNANNPEMQQGPVGQYVQYRLSQSSFIKGGLSPKKVFSRIFLTGNALSLACLIGIAMIVVGGLMIWEGYNRSGNSTGYGQAKVSELSEIRRDTKDAQDVVKNLRTEINGLDDKIEQQYSELREVISRLDKQISIAIQIRQHLAILESKVTR